MRRRRSSRQLSSSSSSSSSAQQHSQLPRLTSNKVHNRLISAGCTFGTGSSHSCNRCLLQNWPISLDLSQPITEHASGTLQVMNAMVPSA